MIRHIAKSLTSRAVKNGAVEQKNSDIYTYGAELMISSVLGVLVALLLSFITGAVLEGAVFIAVFAWLRRYTGGHHADSYVKCIGIFTALIVVALSLIFYTPDSILVMLTIFIAALSLLIVYFIAPVGHKNKPIKTDKKVSLRRKSLALSSVVSITAVTGIFLFPNWTSVFYGMSLSIFFVCASMAYASRINKKERTVQNEKEKPIL